MYIILGWFKIAHKIFQFIIIGKKCTFILQLKIWRKQKISIRGHHQIAWTQWFFVHQEFLCNPQCFKSLREHLGDVINSITESLITERDSISSTWSPRSIIGFSPEPVSYSNNYAGHLDQLSSFNGNSYRRYRFRERIIARRFGRYKGRHFISRELEW